MDSRYKGALITRRSTAKGGVPEKYAADCYLLYQFINGNKVDVHELFKPQPGSFPQRLNSTCIGDVSPTLTSEMTVMRETMVKILTDVNLLKTNVRETQEALRTVSDFLKPDVSNIKLEIEECKLKCSPTIDADKYLKAAESSCLADKLSHIGWMIARLDNSRKLLEQKSRDIEQCISDNVMGLNQLRDRETSGNNALKSQIRNICEKVDDFTEDMISKAPVDSGTVHADVTKHIKDIENRVDEPKSLRLESSFNELLKTMSTKIDKLYSVVEQALGNRPSSQIHGNSHQDLSTGTLTRPHVPQNTHTLDYH